MFVAAAVSVGFVAAKSFLGNRGHSDEWWYMWAIGILFGGLGLCTFLQLALG